MITSTTNKTKEDRTKIVEYLCVAHEMEVKCSWNLQVCNIPLFPFLLKVAIKLGTKISQMKTLF